MAKGGWRGGGRPPGSKNKLTKEEKAIRAEAASEAVEELKSRIVGRVLQLDQEIFSEKNSDDEQFKKESMYKALELANDTAELAHQLASEAEHPRAIEVSANSAKDVAQVVKSLEDWETADKNKRIEQLQKLLDSIARITGADKQQTNVQVNNNMDLAGAFNITKAPDIIDGDEK